MNRINPIHIVVLLTIILIIALYSLASSKRELTENKETFKSTQEVAQRLIALKDVYANKVRIKQSLQRILNDAMIKSSTIATDFKKNSVSIHAENIDLKTLNLLVGKLLNAAYIIESMDIKNTSDSLAELKMEIKW